MDILHYVHISTPLYDTDAFYDNDKTIRNDANNYLTVRRVELTPKIMIYQWLDLLKSLSRVLIDNDFGGAGSLTSVRHSLRALDI